MTLFAWNSYKKFAWGANELEPISQRGYTPSIFGHASNLGATIVDALDTLYIMGLNKEFDDGKEWIENNFDINVVGFI